MEHKRIITFDLPEYKGKKYRAFCHFGYHRLINYNWWVEIQVQEYCKKYIFFGPKISKWGIINHWWLSSDPSTMDELRAECEKLYDECVLSLDRVVEKAMNL